MKYNPMYRPMDSYMMNAIVPDLTWEYVEAAHMWPNSPHPRGSHVYGAFETSRPLTEAERKELQVQIAA